MRPWLAIIINLLTLSIDQMDLLEETPRGLTEAEQTSGQLEELKQEEEENRVSYIKTALALDKIGGLEDADGDCDTDDENTPGVSKKKAEIEREFQAFQTREIEIKNRLSDLLDTNKN